MDSLPSQKPDLIRSLARFKLPCLSASGESVADVVLTPVTRARSIETSPLIEIDGVDAAEHGETAVQMREAERYEYEIVSTDSRDLRLRCSLAARRRSLQPGDRDAGLIETRSYCGMLLMEIVEGEADYFATPLASACIEVRSLKLNYRTQYRGMLRRVAEEAAGLLADSRSSAKVGFAPSLEEQADPSWLHIQLEFLRETIDSREFSAALQRVLKFPHERLSSATADLPTDRQLKLNSAAVRQIVTRHPRRAVPAGHRLRHTPGLATIAERVVAPLRFRELDTPENRFVKFILQEFHVFLAHAERVFSAHSGWDASAALSLRLANLVRDWMGRSLFRELGEVRFAPLGSPVLQRKPGYRELLKWWLRFRAASEMSWQGGAEIFHAGKRDVATLYEYWLFFVLLDWFCRKCRIGSRPSADELIEGLEDGTPNLRLRKRVELGPFEGMHASNGRRLKALFCYNRNFTVTSERNASGSWTRRLHPDYTFTFWPAEFSEKEAERRELLVHIHFDAKYRIDSIEALFGANESEDADDEIDGNYKRQDLLKMHAYRDAIKRSQGAYILYPGVAGADTIFRGFHEILPGLGAFCVSPDESGQAVGIATLESFLDDVLDHLSNRTTSRERVTYHVMQAYEVKEEPVPYSEVSLAENDSWWAEFRALPPAEHLVLAAWVRNEAQAALAELDEGCIFVRLGRRRGALHVHPNLAQVRHVLLRSDGNKVSDGLFLLREPGFRVFTRSEVRKELTRFGVAGISAWEAAERADDDEFIYALFKTTPDLSFSGAIWDGAKVAELIKKFESDSRNTPLATLGRISPYPRILPLRELLKALIEN